MLKSGFFDSQNGDRKYDSEDFSEYFEGIISDGVYAAVGNGCRVFATGESKTVFVDSGRATLANRYIKNTSPLETVELESDSALPRYTAICLSINFYYRAAFVEVIAGTPAVNPEKPTVQDDDFMKYLVLAYVYVPANASIILPENITDNRGGEHCPWVAGIVDTSQIIAQLESTVTAAKSQFDDMIYNGNQKIDEISVVQSEIEAAKTEIETARAEMEATKTEIETVKTQIETVKADFESWYASVKPTQWAKFNFDHRRHLVSNLIDPFESLSFTIGTQTNLQQIFVYLNGCRYFSWTFNNDSGVLTLLQDNALGHPINGDYIDIEIMTTSK